jgi:hypothetical protein
MMGLRRVGLHPRFHAQGTTSRLALRAFRRVSRQGLKGHACSLSLFVSSPSSVACYSTPSLPVEGYVPFFPSSNTSQITLNVSVFNPPPVGVTLLQPLLSQPQDIPFPLLHHHAFHHNSARAACSRRCSSSIRPRRQQQRSEQRSEQWTEQWTEQRPEQRSEQQRRWWQLGLERKPRPESQ